MDAAVAGAADLGRYGRRIVRMIWDPEPINNTSANIPVWCLGQSYSLEDHKHANKQPGDAASESSPPVAAVSSQASHTSEILDIAPDSIASSLGSSHAYEDDGSGGWPSGFLDDFESRFWMTYRSGFELIPRPTASHASAPTSLGMRLRSLGDQVGFTSDSGWGCMIRSGQCLLANALAMLDLGRDWRRGHDGTSNKERQLLSMFADDPRAPYSIHSFVQHGAAACGKHPGEWFGPSATTRCIQALTNAHNGLLRVYSTGDLPDVYEDSFLSTAKPDNAIFHPTLILISTRLGIDKINPVYWEALTSSLQLPQSVGIAGGRPSSSHYFVGAQRCLDSQGSYLFYLDPHHTRSALPYHEDASKYKPEDVDSCHTRRLRRLHIREMDPSMLMAFLIVDEDDWETWKSSVKHVQGKAIITVSPNDPAGSLATGRHEAIDEVEILSDDDDEAVAA